MKMVLEHAGVQHPCLQAWRDAIARDHGVSPAEYADGEVYKAALEEMIQSGVGAKVETRRWLTWSLAAPRLDKVWHTALLALELELLIAGKDPWAADNRIESTLPTVETERAQIFEFKKETFRVLACPLNQAILRSVHRITQRTSIHHGEILASSTDKEATTRFQLLYSDAKAWFSSMVAPALQDAVDAETLTYVGLDEDFETAFPDFIEFPYAGLPEGDDLEIAFFLHIRVSLAHCQQLWLFGAVPQSPPWNFIQVLHPASGKRRGDSGEGRAERSVPR